MWQIDMLGITKADIFWGLKIMSFGITVYFIAVFLRHLFPAYTIPIVYVSVGIIGSLMIKTIRKIDWRLLR
jgi:hypothetical protein